MNIEGIELFVERIEGNKNLNFVLIHNAGGNHQFFTHQIETLKKYGDVIWLDLPGHSNSKSMSDYKMNDLSFIVKRVCENLSLENICLIGLNNGACVVIDAVTTHSLPIKNMIVIDPPIFMEKPFIHEINNFIDQLEHTDYSKFVTSLVDNLFIYTDSHNKEIAADAFNRVDKKALQNIFRGLIEWDANIGRKLKNINCPSLCILTDEHHCNYNKFQQEAPQFEIGKVIGSKCWPTLEVPNQVNAMMERFLILNTISARLILLR